jgi:two-component system sensor histidine kinase ChvG
MFERYFSHRGSPHPAHPSPDDSLKGADGADGTAHFGIGLWIVRRNLAAVGGRVEAVNRAGGGLRISIRVPVARSSARH